MQSLDTNMYLKNIFAFHFPNISLVSMERPKKNKRYFSGRTTKREGGKALSQQKLFFFKGKTG